MSALDKALNAGIALAAIVAASLVAVVAIHVYGPHATPNYPDSIPACSAWTDDPHPVLAPNSVTDTCWYRVGDRVLLSNG